MADTASNTRMSRGLRWLLVISLALNLAVLGMMASWWFNWGKHHRHMPPRIEQVGGPLTRALDRDDRRAIGRAIRQVYREKGEGRAAQKARMEALIADLRADPFDREAVAAHMEAQRETLRERLSTGQALLLDRFVEMDASERAAYADRLEEELQRRRKK